MSITKTQQFTKAWIVADSQATVEAFLLLPERLIAETAVGSLGNTAVDLQGSAAGWQVQGEIATVRKELADLDDKSFTVVNISAVLRERANAPLQVTLNVAQRLMTVTVRNTNQSVARAIFDAIVGVFPESAGISQSELEAKSARLTSLLKESDSLNATAADLQAKSKTIEELTTKAKSAADSATSSAAEATKARQDAVTQRAETLTARQEVQRSLGEITAVKTQVQGEQNAVQQLHQGVTSMEVKVRDFFTRVDEHTQKLKRAEERTEAITGVNADLQNQIREQLIKAVGVGLFGAFDRRKKQVVASKWVWAVLSVVAVLMQVGVVVWLAAEAKELGVATDAVKMLSPLFLLKATAAVPVFFLIWFCVSQYSHERRYEETYAFKTALSFSLAPYLDLVKKTSDHKDADKYREFLVSTVGQVFADPFQTAEKKGTPTDKVLGDVEHLLDSISKFVDKVRSR